ncbi:MAG: biotin/lipoyl-binding protein [Candidatus Competibacteraceae bacterium]
MEDLHSVRRTFLFGSRAEVLLLALLSVFSFSALAQQPAATTRPPTPVSVVEVKPENTPATFEFTGKTASSRQVEINARVEGYLDKIAYEEGSLVKTGQLLFQLDPALPGRAGQCQGRSGSSRKRC